MSYFFSFFAPRTSSRLLRLLIAVTAIISLTVAFIDTLLATFFPSLSLTFWLALSSYGWSHYYLWQPFTHLLLFPAYGQFSFSFLFELAILLYLIWMFGSEVAERIGERSLLSVYFAVGAASGVISLVVWQHGMLAGPTASLFALFTLWTMLGPYGEIILFPSIELRRRWLFAGGIAVNFLIAIAHANWLQLLWYSSGIIGGYLYGVLSWQLIGPFSWTAPFDRFLYRCQSCYRGLYSRFGKQKTSSTARSKIFDFQTGEPILDDDAFVDTMLAKISDQGEGALTRAERKRMDEIAAKRKQS